MKFPKYVITGIQVFALCTQSNIDSYKCEVEHSLSFRNCVLFNSGFCPFLFTFMHNLFATK